MLDLEPCWSDLFALHPQRLVECYELHTEHDVMRAFQIYSHFYYGFPPEMKSEHSFEVRQWVAALALQRMQEKGTALTFAEVEAVRQMLVSR